MAGLKLLTAILFNARCRTWVIGSGETSQRHFRELLKVCADADKPGRSELNEARDASAKQRSSYVVPQGALEWELKGAQVASSAF